MKDKEKQIEEIENMIDDYLQGFMGGSETTLAKKIYDKLLPQNSIVLSREEYELWNILKKTWASDDKEVSAEDMLETLKNTKELGSKETARQLKGKFVDILQEEFYNAGLLDSDLRKIITQRIINEL